jgi:hypothetical protein
MVSIIGAYMFVLIGTFSLFFKRNINEAYQAFQIALLFVILDTMSKKASTTAKRRRVK